MQLFVLASLVSSFIWGAALGKLCRKCQGPTKLAKKNDEHLSQVAELNRRVIS